MEPTQSVARRSPGRWLVLLGILLSALTLSGIAASPAVAEEVSPASAAEQTEEPTAPAEEEEFTNFFIGNVTFEDEPVEGVRITAEGNGFEAETETDAEGKWRIGVPEKGTYTITLDEDTLPEGVVVTEGGATVEAEFGLTGIKAVNFFIGEGERQTTGIVSQVLIRLVNGLERATEGRILIEGQDVTGLTESGWRQQRRLLARERVLCPERAAGLELVA